MHRVCKETISVLKLKPFLESKSGGGGGGGGGGGEGEKETGDEERRERAEEVMMPREYRLGKGRDGNKRDDEEMESDVCVIASEMTLITTWKRGREMQN